MKPITMTDEMKQSYKAQMMALLEAELNNTRLDTRAAVKL